MKAKLFIIASLISGGIIFTSCQKDNSLIEDTSFEQVALEQEAAESPLNLSKNSITELEDVRQDWITNFPDPFTRTTTIAYTVPYDMWVSIIVFKKASGLAIKLVNEFKLAGSYKVEFDASGLPVGKYYAQLKLGNYRFMEEMTKKQHIPEDPEDDDGLAHR